MADKDDAPEVEETEEDTSPGTQDESPAEEDETPDVVKAERDKIRGTLEKIKAERTKLRQELSALKKEKPAEEAPPEDAKLVRMAGITALTAEGLTKSQAKVAVRLLDLSGVEVDDDGDADLEDVISELKETFPGLFPAKEAAPSRRVPAGTVRGDRGGSKTPGAGVLSDTSRRLMKQGGYL